MKIFRHLYTFTIEKNLVTGLLKIGCNFFKQGLHPPGHIMLRKNAVRGYHGEQGPGLADMAQNVRMMGGVEKMIMQAQQG